MLYFDFVAQETLMPSRKGYYNLFFFSGGGGGGGEVGAAFGGLKSQSFEGMYKAKLESSWGEGVGGIFWNNILLVYYFYFFLIL